MSIFSMPDVRLCVHVSVHILVDVCVRLHVSVHFYVHVHARVYVCALLIQILRYCQKNPQNRSYSLPYYANSSRQRRFNGCADAEISFMLLL